MQLGKYSTQQNLWSTLAAACRLDKMLAPKSLNLHNLYAERNEVPASSTGTVFEVRTQQIAMSMITATAWVPRGFAAPFPTKYAFDEEEFQRIAELAKLQLDDANEDLEDARNQAADVNGEKIVIDEDGSDDEIAATTIKSKGSAHQFLFTCALLILATQG